MTTEMLEIVRAANREFQEFIDQVEQKGARMVKSRGATHRLEKVARRLQEVAKFLEVEPRLSPATPDAAHEIFKYRENLQTLRRVMETLQFSLLTEKARLENARANLQAACAWATSVREISSEP